MTTKPLTNLQKVFTVSAKEQRLIEELRKFRFGKVEVTMVDGQPDRIEKSREFVKL